MRITIVGPVYPYRGGIAHYTAVLAQKMEEQGHTVQVISFHRQYPKWLYPGKTDRDTSAKTISVDALYLIDSINPITWVRTAGAIKRHKPDLVLLMWWSTFWTFVNWTIAFQLRRWGIKISYLVHNVLPHEEKFFDRLLAIIGLSAAESYLVQTSEQRKRLLALVPDAKIVEAHHPIYDIFSAGDGARTAAREKFGLGEGEIILLFFGIVRAYKGLMILLEAVGILKAEGIPVQLLAAGEFWDSEESYRQKSQELGIEDRVHLTNRYIENEDVPAFFSAADVFVAPYIGGTQSGSINIAVSFHLPIVMTDKIAESVDQEIHSDLVIVPAGDAAALAEGIKTQIMRRKQDRGSDGQAALDADHSWCSLIAAIMKL